MSNPPKCQQTPSNVDILPVLHPHLVAACARRRFRRSIRNQARESGPESGLGFQVKVLETLDIIPSSTSSGRDAKEETLGDEKKALKKEFQEGESSRTEGGSFPDQRR